MSVNKVILVGNLGADPEVRFTQSGQAVANMRIATNEVFNDRDGNRQERTEWHRIVVWGRLAEICNQYLRKGSKIYIEGRLQTRNWEGQDGQKRYTTEVVARDMQILDSRDDTVTAAPDTAPSPGTSPRTQSDSTSPDSTTLEPPPYGADDDLPF